MTQIERMHCTGRMSRIVIHGDTVYLCGQVDAVVADQTRQTFAKIENLLAEAGSDKDQDPAGGDPVGLDGGFYRNERGLGQLGCCWHGTRPRLRRSRVGAA